jgi:DNA-directed RNA polymerase subunit RPC12/RpoP
MEDASLEDFLKTGEADDESGGTGPNESDTEAEEPPEDEPPTERRREDEPPTESQQTDPDTTEPATVTYEYAPAGVECVACGTETRRRWQSTRGLVCADCKEW